MPLEELYRDPGNGVGALDGRVLIQVRWGEVTVATVEGIGAVAEKIVNALPPDARFGALLIQEPTAAVPDAAARDAQRRVIRPILAGRAHARVAGVVRGTDLIARLRLTMVRMLTVGDERFRHFADVPEAARWLSRELGGQPSAAALEDAVGRLRAR